MNHARLSISEKEL